MNNKEILELAHWVIAQAKKAGADDTAVNLTKQRSIEIGFRDRKLEELTESTQNSLSLDIYSGGKYSSHSTNDLRRGELEKFINEAVSMTKYLNEDPFRTLPDPKYYTGQENIDLKLMDAEYEKIESNQRVDIAREIEDTALGQSDRIISVNSGYSDGHFMTAKVHSNGFEGWREESSYSAGVSVTIHDDGDGRPQDYEWVVVRFLRDLPPPSKLGEKAVERSLEKIGQTKMPSGVYDMVVENRAASRLLGNLGDPLRGRSLQQKSSFLEGKLGSKIASEKFTVIDDPLIIGGLGSRLFDGEGMATRRRLIIDHGILKEYFIDTYYGKKLGMEPTIGSPTNVVFEYGDKSAEEIIKDIKKGIYVTSFIGGNSNSTTGDFSTGIIGMYIEDGKIIKPVNEMNISGNQIDFWNQLVEVGNDPYIYSSMRRPTLHFRDVQFSGI
nr:TldD/PmbA family protein [candidate division Zixibacteria bacterium]